MNKDIQIDQLHKINSDLKASVERSVTTNEAIIRSLKECDDRFTDDEHTLIILALTQLQENIEGRRDIYRDEKDSTGEHRCDKRINEINNLFIKLDLMLGDAMNT